MSKENKLLYYLLAVIMVAGFVLRFYHPFAIPFMYDELSALYRLRFDTFDELIKKGIMPDGHPAGIQVFLYYWTQLFGTREIVVKLPFLLAGTAAVYVTYLVGKLWFGKPTGLLAAASVASLQMFVMYSQIARPYISGLLFCLLMVYYWSRYFFEKHSISNLVFFVFFASLASYDHHFSLLFAAIVGVTGLWFVNRKTVLPYILSGTAIFALYIPHLPVFFSQLQLGGMAGTNDWISKPEPWVLFQFLQWLFHYSWWVAVVTAVVVLLPVLRASRHNYTGGIVKKRIVLAVWFLLPLIIGYGYSVIINPVLQYSVLIFSTPFLFIILFSFAGRVPAKQLGLMVIALLVVNTLTLIFGRDYYKVFYRQPFEQMVKQAIRLEKENPGEVFIINDYVPYYTTYYFEKYGKALPFYTVRNRNISMTGFKKVLSGIEQDIVVTSGLNVNFFQLVKEQFPHWIGYERGFTYEQYTFTKNLNEGKHKIERSLVAETLFGREASAWNYNSEFLQVDTIMGQKVYAFTPANEFGLSNEIPLEQFLPGIHSFIDVEVIFKLTDTLKAGIIVAELKTENELISWNGVGFEQFGLQAGTWQKAFLTIDIQMAMKNHPSILPGQKLKVFVWNRFRGQFMVGNISIYVRPGNRDRYRLFAE